MRRDRPPDNPEIREEMHKIAEKRRRFGYRRVGILLERKGMIMNEKKLYRIYREEGLSVRRRRGRKRARGSRTPIPAPLRPNQRWSLDFLSDTFGACRKFRILAVNDDCCRENLALIADTSISGARVARELDALVRIYGKPACIVSDNGTEFTSKAILKWANANWPSGVTTTTTSGPIPRWATRPRPTRAERLSNLRAPRPARLPHPKPTNINPKDSRYERGTTGGRVTA